MKTPSFFFAPALVAALAMTGCGGDPHAGHDHSGHAHGGDGCADCADCESGTKGSVASAKPVEWEVVSIYKKTLPGLGTTMPRLAADIEKISGGSMKLNVTEPGQIVSSGGDILDAVSEGQVDAGYASATFWSGVMPAAPIFTAIPFGPDAPEYLAWIYYGDGQALYQEMYDRANFNVKVLVAGVSAPETAGWFAQEINSPADLQGKNMRIAGLGGDTLEKLGVATTQMPGGEIFPSLQRGTIDCAEFSTPAADVTAEFYKVAKYNYFPGWHQQSTLTELLINKDVWNELSPTQQALIETACKASVVDALAYSEAIQGKAIIDNQAKGVEIRYWSDEMLAAFEKAWIDVAAEKAAEDAFFKKVWDNLSAFRLEYKEWSQVGFLPRTGPTAK